MYRKGVRYRYCITEGLFWRVGDRDFSNFEKNVVPDKSISLLLQLDNKEDSW